MRNDHELSMYAVGSPPSPKPVVAIDSIEFWDQGKGLTYSSPCTKFIGIIYIKMARVPASPPVGLNYMVKLVDGTLPPGVSLPSENDLLQSSTDDLYFPLTATAAHHPIQPFTLQVTPVLLRREMVLGAKGDPLLVRIERAKTSQEIALEQAEGVSLIAEGCFYEPTCKTATGGARYRFEVSSRRPNSNPYNHNQDPNASSSTPSSSLLLDVYVSKLLEYEPQAMAYQATSSIAGRCGMLGVVTNGTTGCHAPPGADCAPSFHPDGTYSASREWIPSTQTVTATNVDLTRLPECTPAMVSESTPTTLVSGGQSSNALPPSPSSAQPDKTQDATSKGCSFHLPGRAPGSGALLANWWLVAGGLLAARMSKKYFV